MRRDLRLTLRPMVIIAIAAIGTISIAINANCKLIIKRIIRNFKMKVSIVEFLDEKKGHNLSKMFELADTDDKIREEVINIFLFSIPPSKELLLKIKS